MQSLKVKTPQKIHKRFFAKRSLTCLTPCHWNCSLLGVFPKSKRLPHGESQPYETITITITHHHPSQLKLTVRPSKDSDTASLELFFPQTITPLQVTMCVTIEHSNSKPHSSPLPIVPNSSCCYRSFRWVSFRQMSSCSPPFGATPSILPIGLSSRPIASLLELHRFYEPLYVLREDCSEYDIEDTARSMYDTRRSNR